MSPTPEEVAELMAQSDSLEETYQIYTIFKHVLVGWKFIIASETGPVPGYAVNKTFSNGAAVCSLFGSERVVVLDAETVSDMEKGEAKFFIDFSISLDTQALSYIRPYLSGVKTIPNDFQEVMLFIARPEVNVDPLPYLLENTRFITQGTAKERESIFESVAAYEFLRSIDEEYLKKGELRSYLSEEERKSRAQKLLSQIAFDHSHKEFQDEISRRQKVMYSLLMKMTEIQFKRKSATVGDKIFDFLRFLDAELATMFARETLVAAMYFQFGQQGFFGKIQRKSPKLFSNLKNMSWDLWHIRQCEEGLSIKPDKPIRYYFPAFLTFDEDLVKLFNLCPIKMCVIDPTNTLQPVYSGDLYMLMAGGSKEIASKIYKEFYSETARESRRTRRLDGGVLRLQHIDDLITKLEAELSKIAEVDII